MVLRIMRTGLCGRHSVTLATVESDINLQRLGEKRSRPQLIEDVVGIEWTVIVANAGVVAPDDKMRTAEVLTNKGMKQCLARTGVAHLNRIARLNDGAASEIIVDHRLNCSGTDIGRNIAGFQFPKDLMDKDAVGHFHRDFHQVLVTAMHGVSGLEGGDIRPAAIKKHGSCLGGPNIKLRIFDRIFAFAQYPHRPRQVDVSLRQHLGDAGVLRIGRAIDVFRLRLLVDRIFLMHVHDGEDVVGLRVDERDFFLLMDTRGNILIDWQRDRDRPEHAVAHFHFDAGTAPIVVPHEAFEGRIGAQGQHEDVGNRTRNRAEFFSAFRRVFAPRLARPPAAKGV